MEDLASQSAPLSQAESAAEGKRSRKRQKELDEEEEGFRLADKIDHTAMINYKDIHIDVDLTHGQVCCAPPSPLSAVACGMYRVLCDGDNDYG